MSNGKKRDMSPSLEISKRQAIFNTPPRPARSVLEICKTPSCSTSASATGLSNNRASTLDPICPTPSGIEMATNVPVLFPNDSQLRADECNGRYASSRVRNIDDLLTSQRVE